MTLKRLLALLTALCLCLALTACKNDEADASDGVSPEPSAAEPSDSPSDPVSDPLDDIEVDLSQTMYEFSSGLKDSDAALTVNGVDVPNEQFFYWMSTYCYNVSAYAFMYGMSADFTDEDLRQSIIDNSLDAVSYYAVLRQLCQDEGIVVTDEQRQELQDLVDEQGLESILQSCGLTEESFRAIAEDSYLFTNYADHVMGEPTAADLEQYVTDQGIFSVKHILLNTTTEDVTDSDGNVTQTAEEHNAAQKTTAEDLLAQLQSADDLEAKFDELMNQYSEDGGLLTNPDGYTFSDADSLVGGFREAALELEPGQLSGIVETDYGYHIMLRLPVDASQFKDDWLSDGANEAVLAAVDQADVSVAAAISGLDVDSFYNRYMAYGSELYASMMGDQGGDGE